MIDGAMFNSLGDLLVPATFNMLYKQDIGPLMIAVKNLPDSEEGEAIYSQLMHDVEQKYFNAGVNAVNCMVEAFVAKESGEWR